MIQLRSDCLVFETSSGEHVPMSAQELARRLFGDLPESIDPELVRHAVAAVVYFFRQELGRELVNVDEFSRALGKVLQGFGVVVPTDPHAAPIALEEKPARMVMTDLQRLADASGQAFELVFFPLLRTELDRQLQTSPALVRFHGLRGCVKKLLGTRRWSASCQELSDQIVRYLRRCLEDRLEKPKCPLMVV